MSISEETKKNIRALKYRTQELDSKIQEQNPDIADITARINHIKELASKISS